MYSKDPATLRMTSNGKVNRMATVLWYLSDVEGGGETIFPQFGGRPSPRRMDQCEVGLKVKPKKGKVIMFYSLTPDGRGDQNSLHGSCPVEGSSVKWAANKWVWSAPMSKHFETP
jgi:prolyl 4-hydroxylase